MTDQPTFSVFIPTYNRGHTITRALDSIRRQKLNDYEVLVVDDGSTDDTEQAIRTWERDNQIPVRYIYQSNGGKHTAHNTAVQAAKGELFMVLDSDDELTPDCLQKIHFAWSAIPEKEKSNFAGVEGLCITSDGQIHGTRFPTDVLDSNYLEVIGKYGVSGEKRNAIRVDVLEQYPYPVFEGEYHVRPSFLWKQLAHHYRFRYINAVLQVVDFALDGLTATASKRRLRNVQGLFAYWEDDVLHHQEWLSTKKRKKHYAEYARYALHVDKSLTAQWRQVPSKWLWLCSLPRAIPNYLADQLKKTVK